MRVTATPSPDYKIPGPQNHPTQDQKPRQELRISTHRAHGRASRTAEQPTRHKDVARLGHLAALPQEFQQVPELAVDIATDCHW